MEVKIYEEDQKIIGRKYMFDKKMEQLKGC